MSHDLDVEPVPTATHKHTIGLDQQDEQAIRIIQAEMKEAEKFYYERISIYQRLLTMAAEKAVTHKIQQGLKIIPSQFVVNERDLTVTVTVEGSNE